MLGDLGAECIVGRESHVDGGLHLHAFFLFERKFESRNVRIFDVDGHHPNVVRGYSSPDKGWNYATKDGDVVAGGLECPVRKTVSRDGGVWAEIILSETREEFFEACKVLAPRALLCSFTSLRTYADWRYRPEPTPYEHPSGLSFDTAAYPELDAWVSQALEGLELVSVVRLRRAEYILCPSFYDAMLRLVTRSLRRADASMFTLLTKQDDDDH